jgi:hypothetical protein
MAKTRILLPLLATLPLVFAASAQGSSVRVPADYFGVNFQRIANLTPAGQDQHLASMTALGITQVRFNVSWAAIEPNAPVNDVQTYRWAPTDERVAAMARHGIRSQPTITQTPTWAAVDSAYVDLQCAKASSRSPLAADPYVRMVQAFAQRYGRQGSFWAAHPELPYAPVVQYEIWNEPNLKGGWCPRPQPWLYADLFVGAAQAIRAVDPNARIVTGGVAPPSAKNAKNAKQYMGMADFFGQATARRPQMSNYMSAAAVHIYPSIDPQKQLDKLAWFRSQLQGGRIPSRIPMLINEIGWATHVGKVPLTESQRADAYAAMTVNFARTNCNVGGILPHTWITPQQSKSNPEDWYGIADPQTAAPYESGRAFVHGLRLLRGQLPVEAPTQTLTVCTGMPLPDVDHDGYPDENDYYPLDPTRH